MSLLKSLCSAFLMYSRIPVPQVEWKEENRRYSLCFFPLVGAVIAVLIMLWWKLCGLLSAGSLFFAVGFTVIPVFVTGGIHIDGFCDVNDALASYLPKEKMLEIMKDPHIGSFALIKLCIYFLLQTALLSEVSSFSLLVICTHGFVQSRAWSGLAAVTFPNARGEGSLQNFSNPAHKKIAIIVEIIYLLISSAVMIVLNPICGTAAFLCGGAVFIYYRIFSLRRFGGITGDLAGYFLQLCEIWIIAGAVIANLLSEAVL